MGNDSLERCALAEHLPLEQWETALRLQIRRHNLEDQTLTILNKAREAIQMHTDLKRTRLHEVIPTNLDTAWRALNYATHQLVQHPKRSTALALALFIDTWCERLGEEVFGCEVGHLLFYSLWVYLCRLPRVWWVTRFNVCTMFDVLEAHPGYPFLLRMLAAAPRNEPWTAVLVRHVPKRARARFWALFGLYPAAVCADRVHVELPHAVLDDDDSDSDASDEQRRGGTPKRDDDKLRAFIQQLC